MDADAITLTFASPSDQSEELGPAAAAMRAVDTLCWVETKSDSTSRPNGEQARLRGSSGLSISSTLAQATARPAICS